MKSSSAFPSNTLANQLHKFYCRFDTHSQHLPILTSPESVTLSSLFVLPFLPSNSEDAPIVTISPATRNFTPSPASTPPALHPAFTAEQEDVHKLFRKQNTRKAAGPNGVSGATLRHLKDLLAPVFTGIFNTSLQSCKVPTASRLPLLFQFPRKTRSLASVITHQSLWRQWSWKLLMLAHLGDITDPLLDPQQFAYRNNMSSGGCSQLMPPSYPSLHLLS